jgi:hypothetical protein
MQTCSNEKVQRAIYENLQRSRNALAASLPCEQLTKLRLLCATKQKQHKQQDGHEFIKIVFIPPLKKKDLCSFRQGCEGKV